jgi:hypothetical protein
MKRRASGKGKSKRVSGHGALIKAAQRYVRIFPSGRWSLMTQTPLYINDIPGKKKHTHTYMVQELPFTWKQTLQDLTLNIPVPPGTKARDLIVDIKKTKLKVGLKGKEPILDGTLCKEIKVEESTWTLGGSVRSVHHSFSQPSPFKTLGVRRLMDDTKT